MSHKKGVPLFNIFALVGLMIGSVLLGTAPVYAANGSGTNSVTPTSTDVSSTGNTFTFTSTAAETMDSGGISIAVPAGWSAPQENIGTAGYITATSPSGIVGDVVTTADSATGWQEDDFDACSTLSATAGTVKEGTASIQCINTQANGPDDGDSFSYRFANADWSGYTKLGVWLRSSVAISSAMNYIQVAYVDGTTGTDLGDGAAEETFNVQSLAANTWTYFTFDLTAARSSINGVGIICKGSGCDSRTIFVDYVLLGPGSPTISGAGPWTVNVPFLTMPSAGTATITYGSGGGTSGVTAPSTAGDYTFTTQSRFDAGGTLTSIGLSPVIQVRNPVPTTTGISPSSKTVGDAQFTMTVNGTNFVSASVVRLNGSDRTTVFASSTQLTATIPASDMTAPTTTAQITVFNPTPGGGVSNAQTFTVNKANITITLGSSLNPSTYGDSVTFTATTTSSVSTPTGTVTFFNGATPLATSTLTGGVATLATSTLSIATHSITAVYNGDTNFNASTSATVLQTVNKANITITLDSSLNPSTYGDLVTFTATTTSGVGTPSGTVTFKNGGVAFATSTLTDGVATVATSTLTVGAHSITATYNGDATFNASTSAAVSQTVNKANITITLGSSLNPSTYGDLVTFTATTTSGAGTPSGTVTFKDGVTNLATSTLTGGVATFAVSALTVGAHSITAVYNGDATFNASTSAAVSQTVNKANITITLASSLNPSTYGDSVTFTATTTATAGTPSGTVTFFDGATPLATSTLTGGVATLATSSLNVATHSITAVYNGDTNFNASTSAAVSQTVNKANITITLGSSLNPSTYGNLVTFTATTTSSVSTPTGTATFFDGATPLATSTLTSGVATFATSVLTIGAHSIIAVYNGDTNFNASTSAAVSQTVNKANITITLGSSLNPSTYGDSVTFIATTTSGVGTPSGTVTFFNGATPLATSTLSSGVATFLTDALTVGAHSITATYNGDATFNASTSAAVSQTVNKANITITLASSLNPSTYGDSVTFTATTTATAGTPSGTVTFKNGGVAFATSTLTGGVAIVATSTLTVGAHSITATYNGDTNFNVSTSAAVAQTVNKADITITLDSSLNPSTYGDAVTFTATTTSSVGTPSGTVTFFNGATPLATSTLTGGVATLATSSLTVGVHSITAVYNGDANFNASTSAAVAQTVNKANITITLGSSLNPSTYGDSVTFTATTTALFGTPSGTVTFFDGVVSLGDGTLSGGVATLATSSLAVGAHSITATYNGDTNFNASTSAAVSQTVNKANITITLASSLNPSTYGDLVTFTATTTSGLGTPSGTVTFKNGGVAFATSTLTGGVATVATSTLTVGAHSITATYNGDDMFNASTSAAVLQTVNKADITITLDSSLNPSTYGDLVTFTATTTSGAGTPSGTVTFKDGVTNLATSTLTGGVATFATSALTVGAHSITAVYNGDTNFNASTSAAVVQVVNKMDITITLGSSLNPSTYSDSVTFTATTTALSGTPSGTVTFFNGATPLATSTMTGGVATFVTSTLSATTHSITATYNGDTNFNASTSAAVSQVVNKANITIIMGSSLNPSTYGDSVTFTATTTSGVDTPSGTVTFFNETTPLATSTLTGGVATFATDVLLVGTHSITAVYNGDANFNASTSAAVSQVVNKKSVTITLGSSLNPSAYGDLVTFTATTTALSGTPTGDVTFFNGATPLATSTIAGGVATFATSSLAVGVHSITAVYNGDTNFNASTSAAVLQTVNKANITITLASSLNPSTYGDLVTFTAMTTSGVGTPSGTVTFKNGGVAFATSTLTDGVATLATSTLSIATHSITATYNGDTNFNASTSAAVLQTVNKANITITLDSSLNPSTYGDLVTFTATTTSGVGTPSGTVTFKDGVTNLATSTLTGGIATFATDALAVGAHSITAVYNGDANFNASTSATVSQVVNNPTPIITLLSPNTIEEGSATTSLTISGSRFASDATVTFDGTPLTIDTQSSTTINTTIPASLVTAFGTSTVAVINPVPGGGTATSSFIITRGAAKFVFNGHPYSGTVDAPITITIQAQRENGTVVTNYQNDVTLNVSGSALPESVLINIINGVGTTTISNTVAEIVTLTLADTQSTGLDVTATTSATFGHGAITQFTLAGPATLNVGDRAEFTTTRKDQYGNPVTSGPDTTVYFYTTSTSSSAVFYDAATNGNTITSAIIGSGASTTMAWYYDEDPGVYTITASDNGAAPDGDTGINDATSTLTVNAVATRFVIIDPTDGTVDAPITVVVQAQDNLGRLITDYQNDVTLIASSTGGLVNATSTLVGIVNGSGTTTISNTVAETVFLSLADSQGTGLNVASSTQDVVFAPGEVTQFSLTHSGDMEQNTRKEFVAGRKDQYGNFVSASTTQAYLYASPTSTAKFYDADAGGNEITAITLTPGNATTSFWLYSNTPATTTVTVSDNATTPDGDTNINDAVNEILVTPIAVRFEIVDPTDGTVDAPITVTVRALDEFGQVVPSFTEDVTLLVTGSAVANPVLVDLENGVGTTQVSDTVAETVTLTLSDTQSTGLVATSTQNVVFAVGAFAKLNLNNVVNATAGDLVAYTVTRTDQYDNQITSGSITVNLSATPTTTPGTFYSSNATSSSVITSVAIDSGNAVGQFWYYNEVADSYQVTAQTGAVIGYDDIVINAAAIAKFTINDRTSMNPASRVQYTVVRKDQFNNLVTTGDTTAYLYADPAGVGTSFYDAATNGNVVTSVAIGSGQSSQNAWYYEETSGAHTITASDNATAPDGAVGVLDASDVLSVQTATGTRFVFNPDPDPLTITAGNSSLVTIQVQDDFGNIDTNYQNDITLVTGVTSVSGTGLTNGQALIDIVNGEGTITLTDTVAETVNMALSDSQGTGLVVTDTASLVWTAGAVTQFTITDQASIVAGTSTPYTVTRKDQYGNTVTSGSNLVYLYSNSTGASARFQATETGTSSISFVTLANGFASTTFWYYDEDAGTWDITASDNATTADGATGIADASDSLIVTAAPVVADRYIILDPPDAGLNENIVVIIQAQDADGGLDTTVQEDVYLAFSTSSITSSPMKLDGRALVSVVDGIGTVTISDSVAETVQLSLERLTGSTSTLAITSTQDVMFFVRQVAVGGGGGGGSVYVAPTVTFSGRAYPGASVSLFARIGGQDIPLERNIEVRADGTFTIDFSGALRGLESFGLAILDKDGNVAQIKTYTMDKITRATEQKNLYIAPTAGLIQRTVTIGNNAGIAGSAAPGSVIRAEVDGQPVAAQAQVGNDGTYRLLVNTNGLAYGGHIIRMKQVDKDGIESDWSPSKVFMVSRALVTQADLNNNGGIDIGDWSIFLTRFASTDTEARKQVDLNNDGKVDISDFSVFIRSVVNR
ncbi:TPA: hypothetical protein DDX30_01165 [Candidatus Wolfebacteria bacterium]|nr:hypothetical protein [Candidatus Wolfebacteria bacterium]